jgi:hypothetical protein
MQRKTPDEKCDRLRTLDVADFKRQCLRYVQDHSQEISSARPDHPATLSDRATFPGPNSTPGLAATITLKPPLAKTMKPQPGKLLSSSRITCRPDGCLTDNLTDRNSKSPHFTEVLTD